MSIITRTGDDGTTALMYNRRVPKTDPRVEAYGTVDEFNAALGLARSLSKNKSVRKNIAVIQEDLVFLMGELATAVQDYARYRKTARGLVDPAMTQRVDALAVALEKKSGGFRGWATPGDHPASAALDVARTVCRRAERQVCALREAKKLPNPEIIRYLNRLSDWLWLLARQAAK